VNRRIYLWLGIQPSRLLVAGHNENLRGQHRIMFLYFNSPFKN
jgi:hypothetical protein